MNKFGFWKTLFIILAVVVFILLFIILLGRVSPTKLASTAEFKEDPETARKKNRRYRVFVESKKKLQIQLKKTFKRMNLFWGKDRINCLMDWITSCAKCHRVNIYSRGSTHLFSTSPNTYRYCNISNLWYHCELKVICP